MKSSKVNNCILCKSKRNSFFTKAYDSLVGKYFTYNICLNCGLIFQNRVKTEKEWSDYYLRQYYIDQQGNEKPTAKKRQFGRKRANHLACFIKKYIPSINCHLDIGCAGGELLDKVNNIYGCQSYGIEPSLAHRNYLKNKYSFKIYSSVEKLIKQSDRTSVDLASFSHVLEHLPDPQKSLEIVRNKLLAKNGYLLIEVPNFFVHTSFENSHLFVFNIKTLVRLITASGFRIIKIKLHSIPRKDLRKQYITILAQKSDKILKQTFNDNLNIFNISILLAQRAFFRSKLFIYINILCNPKYLFNKIIEKYEKIL